MKAIHNVKAFSLKVNGVGNYKLKYNFESNSQQETFLNIKIEVGNYKLKYNFESNSQRYSDKRYAGLCWEL